MNIRFQYVPLALTAALVAIPVARSADSVKVGFITTVSGPAAATGIDVRNAFTLAVKLLKGKLGGLPAEVFFQDDERNPETGKQIAERMIKQNRVDFPTGHCWLTLRGMWNDFPERSNETH